MITNLCVPISSHDVCVLRPNSKARWLPCTRTECVCIVSCKCVDAQAITRHGTTRAMGKVEGVRDRELGAHVHEAEHALVRQVNHQECQECAGLACDRAVGQRAHDGEPDDARRPDTLFTTSSIKSRPRRSSTTPLSLQQWRRQAFILSTRPDMAVPTIQHCLRCAQPDGMQQL